MQLNDLSKVGATGGAAVGALPVVMWSLVILLVVAVLAGGYAGKRWADGGHAIADNAELKTYVSELKVTVRDLREHSAAQAVAYKNATDRLDAIAQERENDRAINQQQAAAMRADLERLLALRPDLRSTRAGVDVLRHWNQSNARPTAAPAAAGSPAKPEAALPGPAGGNGRSVERPAGQSRPGRGAAPQLPKRDGQADSGRGRAERHGMAVVLRCSRSCRHQG